MKNIILLITILFFTFKISLAQKSIHIKCSIPTKIKGGSSINLAVSVNNNLVQEATGTLNFAIINTTTHTSVDGWFLNIFPFQYFTATPKQIFSTTFPFTAPSNFNGKVKFIITANCNNVTDSVVAYALIYNNLKHTNE